MVHAQLGQQPLAHTTETSLQPRQGTRSCLSAWPPDLADAARTRPRVVAMFLSTVPFVYSKRAAWTRILQRAAATRSQLVSRWTIERFVAISNSITAGPLVELPCPRI